MLDPTTLSPAERRIYLHGVQNGLNFARIDPDGLPRALEVAELELQLAFS